MPIYINGMGNISIQDTYLQQSIVSPLNFATSRVSCIDPDFKLKLSPIALRRMSKIIKRAIMSAIASVEESQIAVPDAIISGTGLGCIEDTEKFLLSMIHQQEEFLQPTFFIQSTHNTISSQIAIQLKCNSYNSTYSHRGISFESALYDAFVQFMSGQINSALVGGYDEMTPTYFEQLKKLHFWKEEMTDSLTIYPSSSPGSFSGEGCISFMLSSLPAATSYAEIKGMTLLYRPDSAVEVCHSIDRFLKEHGLTRDEVDLVMTGVSGDATNDRQYESVNDFFPTATTLQYKNLCGEFFTAPAFGLWSAASILKKQSILPCQIINKKERKAFKNLLLYNHYQNKNHSLILLSSCGC